MPGTRDAFILEGYAQIALLRFRFGPVPGLGGRAQACRRGGAEIGLYELFDSGLYGVYRFGLTFADARSPSQAVGAKMNFMTVSSVGVGYELKLIPNVSIGGEAAILARDESMIGQLMIAGVIQAGVTFHY